MSRLLSLSLLCAGAAGCGSAPTPNEVSTVAPERVYAWQKPSPGTQRLVVARDAHTGPACAVDTLIDGSRVARLEGGETASFYLWPGEHVVSVSGVDRCPVRVSEFGVTLKTGVTPSYRIRQDANGVVTLVPR